MQRDLKNVLFSEERECGNREGAETSGFSAGDGSRAFDETVGEAGNGGTKTLVKSL